MATSTGIFKTVYDPKTGREFISPAQAEQYGVKDYVTSLPKNIPLPAPTQKVVDEYKRKNPNLTQDEILGVIGGYYEMTGEQFRNYEIQGTIRSADQQKVRDAVATQSGGLTPEQLTAKLQAFKAKPPTTAQQIAEQGALYADYANRYANSNYNYSNMGGKPQDFSLKPAEYLATPFTGYAAPINQYLSGTNQMTPTFDLMQDILTKKPEISQAIQTVLSTNPDAFKGGNSVIEATIRNLSADIDQLGSDTALRNFYAQQQNIGAAAAKTTGGLLQTPTAVTAPPVTMAAPPATQATQAAQSAALTYALNNGMSADQYYKRIFDYVANNQNMTDTQLRAEMDRLGVSPADVATATGVPIGGVQSRYTGATPPAVVTPPGGLITTPPAVVTPPAVITPPAVVTPPTVVTPPARVNPPAVVTPPARVNPPAVVTPPTRNSAGLAYALSHGMTADQYYKNIFEFYRTNSGLSDSMLRSEMDRLGVSPEDVAKATGVPVGSVLSRYNASKATTAEEIAAQQKAQADLAAREAQWATQQRANESAWAAQQAKNATDWAAQQKLTQNANSAYANAPQTLGDKFTSYQSIPIGAQYNPAVTAGGVSPYSQVMSQMQPFENPYASFVPGTPLGGYNPNLYSQIAVRDANAAAAKAAADAQAANNALLFSGDDGGAAAAAAAAASAADSAAASAASASGTAPGSDGSPGSGAAMGGLITSVWGENPPGPDDGAKYLDIGEYVIKKSSVNKYGRGLLDMINEGRIPSRRIRSLLD